MCRRRDQGGPCAGHTRPKFEGTAYGDPKWADVARDYASTNEGWSRLRRETAEARALGNVEYAEAVDDARRRANPERHRVESLQAERRRETQRAFGYRPADDREPPLRPMLRGLPMTVSEQQALADGLAGKPVNIAAQPPQPRGMTPEEARRLRDGLAGR